MLELYYLKIATRNLFYFCFFGAFSWVPSVYKKNKFKAKTVISGV